MVAGGEMDGVAGRHAAKAGDAYFFRLNATVGYYSASDVQSRILFVRSWCPAWCKGAWNIKPLLLFPEYLQRLLTQDAETGHPTGHRCEYRRSCQGNKSRQPLDVKRHIEPMQQYP